jgi:hypothetical protein
MRTRALRQSFVGSGIRNDGLRRLHFAIVEIQKRALLVDRGRAGDGVIDLELADQVGRGRADHSAGGIFGNSAALKRHLARGFIDTRSGPLTVRLPYEGSLTAADRSNPADPATSRSQSRFIPSGNRP